MGWKGILGFDYGVVQAPLGPDISGPELVAAVANAGCLGFLRAPDTDSPDYLRELIRETKTRTSKPFGVGVVVAFPHSQNVKVILEEKIPVIQVSWGVCCQDLVNQVHKANAKIISQVGSIEEAERAIAVSVDAIIVQGYEAGGHVHGKESLISLLPRVVDRVKASQKNITIIAAGGITDPRGYVAVLALGAHGVALGTRFVATTESYAHDVYKQKIVELEMTAYTNVFGRARWPWPGASHRILRTPFFNEWQSIPDHVNETNKPIIGRTVINGLDEEIPLFSGAVPNAVTEGTIENMAMYAGQGVGLIKKILPAAKVIEMFVGGAQVIMDGMRPKK